MKKIPKIKKQQDIFSKKNSSLIFVFSMLFFFYGVFIALAQSPDLPSNEKKGGWLGEILNLEKTNSEKLIFESEYVGVGINDPQVWFDLANGIRPGGATTLTCTSETEGVIRYNTTSNQMEFCNGSLWKNIFDKIAPTGWNLTISSTTNYQNINLQITCPTDETSTSSEIQMYIDWSGLASGGKVWEQCTTSKNVFLTNGDGSKQITIKWRDNATNETNVLSKNTNLITACNLPWWGTIAHGQSVTAYFAQNSLNCAWISQTRTCSNASLSGSAQYQSCFNSCYLPWGGTILHGQMVTAFASTTVPCGNSCSSQNRICIDGYLTGSYGNQNCKVLTCWPYSYSAWSACSKTCWGGIQTRTQYCNYDSCYNPQATVQSCNTQPCCVWNVGQSCVLSYNVQCNYICWVWQWPGCSGKLLSSHACYDNFYNVTNTNVCSKYPGFCVYYAQQSILQKTWQNNTPNYGTVQCNGTCK